MGRAWTRALVERRLHDAEKTVKRLRWKIARDPGSVHVPVMEGKLEELDAAIQLYRAELELRMEG